MELRTITDSDDLVRQCYAYYSDLRREMDQWLKQSVRLDPPGPNQGGEDEANYALAWLEHYLVTGSADVLDHFHIEFRSFSDSCYIKFI